MNGADVMTLSKKMLNAQKIEANAYLFSCPVCSERMELVNSSQLICRENHSFDLSRQGYINLAQQAHVTKYDQALFEARKKVIDSGFFNPLLDCVTELISVQVKDKVNPVIVDAGCGEGSHLSAILSNLGEGVTGVGIDLSKEGIIAAAKDHPGNIWAVADLANCPFQDSGFDVVLNILSPANYAQFTRLLKPDGLFVKVVPEIGYLKELRDVFYEKTDRQSDTDPVARIKEHFDTVKTKRITYDFLLDSELLATLIRMTPLTWGASDEKIEEALRIGIPTVTIDFTVIIASGKQEKTH